MRGRTGTARVANPLGSKLAALNNDVETLKWTKDGGISQVMDTYVTDQKGGGVSSYDLNQMDTVLVLDDGLIPVHGALLSGASKFFRAIFDSQGPFILGPRTVIMPEFRHKIVQKVIQLLYERQVYVKTEREADEVRDMATSLGIDHKSNGLVKHITSIKIEDIKMFPVSAKAQVLSAKGGVKSEFVKATSSVKSDDGKSSRTLKPRSSARAPSRKAAASESDSSDSNSSDSDYVQGRKKRRSSKTGSSTSKTKTVVTASGKTVEIKDLSINVQKINGSKSIDGDAKTASKSTVGRSPVVPVASSKTNTTKTDDDSETPTDYEADEGRYKNKQWFLNQAKMCQKCKEDYPDAASASRCMSRHSRLRCYFCFRVCRSTEKLFEHFQRAHKKAGRENFVMCPYCDQSIPFKSVSCHVISLHLSDNNKNQKTPAGRVAPGRPPNQAMDVHPSKRPRLADPIVMNGGDLKIGSLDCTIKHVKGNGKTWIFHLKKTRT